MADTRNNPSFKLFPLNNARTGFKPYAMPVIYIEPRRLNSNGTAILDSETLRIRYRVVDAPLPAKVNGEFNQHIRIPDESLFEIELSSAELALKQIDLSSQAVEFVDAEGNTIDYEDAGEGDFFKYIQRGTIPGAQTRDIVPYYPDAYYYDVSDVAIDVSNLPMPKQYFFVWESSYFRRLATVSDDLKCISNDVGLSQRAIYVDHPGQVHFYMYRTSPSLYFDYEGFATKDDSTLEFYRPLADILNDIYDEQTLLDGINQVDRIPIEYVPYLAYLIGWNLPNFPGTTAELRRTMLKRGAELQKLKSSRRAITELFEMFGFVIEIVNLYASVDGNTYLAPGNGLDTEYLTQTDMMLSDFDAAGFGIGETPLTYRPIREPQVVLYAWLVEDGSEAYDQLIDVSNTISDDLEALNQEGKVVNQLGFLQPSWVSGIDGEGQIGKSIVVVGDASFHEGRKVINHNNISYIDNENLLSLFFDHELSVDAGAKVFIYAVYERTKVIVPDRIKNTRTNKFDINIVDRQGFSVDFDLLTFLLDFLFNLKSFHSILRKIVVGVNSTEVYNVIDMCVDGNDPLAPCTLLGELQTPPATLTAVSNCDETEGEKECVEDEERFKPQDQFLRQEILEGLEEEFQAWKALADDCALTPDGQDKVLASCPVDASGQDECPDYDHEPDERETYCEEDESNPDYCYAGRVEAILENILSIPLREYQKCTPCGPHLGNVVYWEEPSIGDASNQSSGLLRKSITNLNGPPTLHYSDDPYLDCPEDLNSQNTLALSPVSIDIVKDNLSFPAHRFLSMGKLEDDFNFTASQEAEGIDRDIVRARPWDDNGVCGEVNQLNAYITEYTDGVEVLVWDDADLVYVGNGLEPDIPSLEDHGDPSTDDGDVVTHKIYQYSRPSHESITFDQSVIESEHEFIDTSIIETGAIFRSVCEDTSQDYIGGYPAVYNWQLDDPETFEEGDTSISGTGEAYLFCDCEVCHPIDEQDCYVGALDRPAISEGLGLPQYAGTGDRNVRYYTNSQLHLEVDDIEYRFYEPYRIDCECLNNSCEETVTELDNTCNAPAILDEDGDLYTDCDRVEMDVVGTLSEALTLCSRITDFDLPNLFCLDTLCTVQESGHFVYQDDYDVIYEVEWIISEDTLDMTVITKDPRVPGEPPDGYTERDSGGVRIYRKGVITIKRQIVKFVNGTWIVEAVGHESEVGYFQVNIVCGDDAFDQPFAYGVDCAIKDNVELLTTDGPHWMEPTPDATASALAISKTEYMWADPLNAQYNDLYWSSFGSLEVGSSESSESEGSS